MHFEGKRALQRELWLLGAGAWLIIVGALLGAAIWFTGSGVWLYVHA